MSRRPSATFGTNSCCVEPHTLVPPSQFITYVYNKSIVPGTEVLIKIEIHVPKAFRQPLVLIHVVLKPTNWSLRIHQLRLNISIVPTTEVVIKIEIHVPKAFRQRLVLIQVVFNPTRWCLTSHHLRVEHINSTRHVGGD